MEKEVSETEIFQARNKCCAYVEGKGGGER